MKKELKRKSTYSIPYLIPAGMFSIVAIMRLNAGDGLAMISFLAAGLFFLNFVWSTSTPYISIDEDTLQIKQALLNQKSTSLKDIQSSEIKKNVLTIRTEQRKFLVNLKQLNDNDRTFLVEKLTSLSAQL